MEITWILGGWLTIDCAATCTATSVQYQGSNRTGYSVFAVLSGTRPMTTYYGCPASGGYLFLEEVFNPAALARFRSSLHSIDTIATLVIYFAPKLLVDTSVGRRASMTRFLGHQDSHYPTLPAKASAADFAVGELAAAEESPAVETEAIAGKASTSKDDELSGLLDTVQTSFSFLISCVVKCGTLSRHSRRFLVVRH